MIWFWFQNTYQLLFIIVTEYIHLYIVKTSILYVILYCIILYYTLTIEYIGGKCCAL
jgi:hypothetical protein